MKNILILENDRYCANKLIRKLKEINPDARIYEPITMGMKTKRATVLMSVGRAMY